MINLPHNINFLEYSVFTDALNKLPSAKKVLISTINQYSYCIAKKDFLFKKMVHLFSLKDYNFIKSKLLLHSSEF